MSRSPICIFESIIQSLPVQISPENKEKAEEYGRKYSISFELIDDIDFSIRVNLDSNTIILPIASLEYLWTFSHYSWVLYQEYRSAQLLNEEVFDCVGNSRLQNAYYLQEWARNNLNSTGTEEWPDGYLIPEIDSQEEDILVANQLFLFSLAWMIYHEMGHIVLKHPPMTTGFLEQEERDADRFATKWMLDKLEEGSPIIKKRALCIAVGLLCLQSFEVTDSSLCLKNAHPDAHERIYDCLSKYNIDNDETVEALVSLVLKYLFHENEEVKLNVHGDSFRDVFQDILYDIHKVKKS